MEVADGASIVAQGPARVTRHGAARRGMNMTLVTKVSLLLRFQANLPCRNHPCACASSALGRRVR